MFLKDGKYYLMWSEGGWTGPNYSVAYAIGSSPLGPFEHQGTVLRQDEKIATGAGHHSVLCVPGKGGGPEEWFIVYHRRPLGKKGANDRVTCIDRMEFDGQGKIKPIRITHEGVGARLME
jgi:beta-xylosidase